MSTRKQPPLPLPPLLPSGQERSPRRRSLRKGTISCWECKRRKTKCNFRGSSTDGTCDGCRRRGVPCVSQEFPEVSNTKQHIGERLGRVERLVSQLTDKTEGDGAQAPDGQDVEPEASFTQPAAKCRQSGSSSSVDRLLRRRYGAKPWSSTCPGAASTSSSHNGLNEVLLEAWPSQQDLEVILSTSISSSAAYHGVICIPYAQFKAQHLPSPRDLLQPPSPQEHPVAISRKLLTLAAILQSLAPTAIRELVGRLSTTQQAMMSRAVETAARLVNSDDELASTIEGVECIMMESMYHNNAGNLRRAYITMRRALTIAQTLGLDRGGSSSLLRILNSRSKERLSHEHMWFRIVQSDRYLSLMLGLPQGSTDDTFAVAKALEACTPIESLERVLTMVGGRIIQRTGSKMYSLEETLEIDRHLLDAAALMPARWWLPVNLAGMDKDGIEAIDTTLRVTTQLAYYHTLGRLHFPHLLQNSDDRWYDYSRMTAITASRELLSRFIAFRVVEQGAGSYCRGVDFLAFIASTAMCIGHMHSRAQCQLGGGEVENAGKTVPHTLAHQRLTDRGLMEHVLEIMDQAAASEPSDPIAGKIAVILRQLLAIEADVAQGVFYSAAPTDRDTGGELECHGTASDDGRSLLISLPHIGAFKIERQETRFVKAQNLPGPPSGRPSPRAEGQCEDSGFSMPTFELSENATMIPGIGDGGLFAPDVEGDWVLQGVDIALFDSLCWEVGDHGAQS